MFEIFTMLADWATYSVLGLEPQTKLADASHFFIEDVTKILSLLVVMIYSIALLRASLSVEKVRVFWPEKIAQWVTCLARLLVPLRHFARAQVFRYF